MKKITTLTLALLMVCTVCLFVACSNSSSELKALQETVDSLNTKIDELENTVEELKTKKEYKKVPLTSLNYSQYLAVNYYFEDYFIDYIETNSIGTRTYNLYCTCIVSTQRKTDCHFENVKITLNSTSLLWSTHIPQTTMSIGYDGVATNSFIMYRNNVYDSNRFQLPEASNVNLSITISGYVLIPEA